MGDALGLSIGATRFAAVRLGRSALTRQAPPMRHGETLVAEALRELTYCVTNGRSAATPATVTYPAHWRRAQVDALRSVLRLPMVSDAAATVSALQSECGLPARGVVALCDVGGTGASITLLDASRGYAPIGPTVRHAGLAGDLIDRALVAHVLASVDGTSALDPLRRLWAQCRAAKERLSESTATALTAHLPGFSGNIRLTRAELEELIREPLADFVRVLQKTLDRGGVRRSALAGVASVGGGARIPVVTTALSERFRVPVITTAQPELAAASGAALRAAWVPVFADADADADAHSTTFRALAWSEAYDVPPLARPTPVGVSSARPRLEFTDTDDASILRELPWYRRTSTIVGIGAIAILLLATSAVVAFGSDTDAMSSTSVEAPAPRTVHVAPAPAPAEVLKPPHYR